MKTSITMTSKGTFTLPIAVRKSLGVQSMGDKLLMSFDSKSKRVIITKPRNFKDMQAQNAKLISKKAPLVSVGDFYNTTRRNIK
jgi:bifunctional DNA-binding transcriptional regulator/antitoxin component of YhaV-PrlF toxin-antitoxin module